MFPTFLSWLDKVYLVYVKEVSICVLKLYACQEKDLRSSTRTSKEYKTERSPEQNMLEYIYSSAHRIQLLCLTDLV